MRKWLTCMAAAAFVATATPMLAQEKAIKGEVVDVDCYTKDKTSVGKAHEQCAVTCARQGKPQAILASDGLYMIAGEYTKDKNAKLIEFVAKIVEAKGEVSEKDGQKTIAVTAMTLAK